MNLRWVRGISITAIGEGGAAILARLPLSWRGLGALVLGVLLAQWCWILLAPQAMTIATVTERSAAVETGHLFGQSRSEVTSVDGMALSNVRLVGVFAASVGKPGFAVLKLDDKHQVGVAVGGTVAPGTKLLEVHPDYVLLERAGVQQRVNFDGKAAASVAVNEAAAKNRVRSAQKR